MRIVEADALGVLTQRVARLALRLTTLRRTLQAAFKVQRIDEGECDSLFKVVYALDSAFPPAPIELLGLSLSMIAHGWVRVEDGVLRARKVKAKVLTSFKGLSQDTVHAVARRLEREDALSVLENEDNIDLLVFDGEIVPLSALRRTSRRWLHVKELSYELLRRALRRGCTIVGVIKRVRSTSISKRLGLKINDKALLTVLLKRGEYLVVNHEVEEMKKLGCCVVFYKPLRGVAQAVKVEVCPGRGTVERVVSFLSREAGPTSLPWFSDAIDGLVRAELKRLDQLIGSLQRAFAEAAEPLLAGPSDLQKQQRKT